MSDDTNVRCNNTAHSTQILEDSLENSIKREPGGEWILELHMMSMKWSSLTGIQTKVMSVSGHCSK